MGKNRAKVFDFFGDVKKSSNEGAVGVEIDTLFVDGETESPATEEQTQELFEDLADESSYETTERRRGLIMEIGGENEETVSFDLAQHNVEVAMPPVDKNRIIPQVKSALESVYQSAEDVNIDPLFEPILKSSNDVLVVSDQDEYLQTKVDGRPALNEIASCASVRFEIVVTPENAIEVINNLNAHRTELLEGYSQDDLWRKYMEVSYAGYDTQRYGGPKNFLNLEDYVKKLTAHKVIDKEARGLVPFELAEKLRVSHFVDSVWWYFRLVINTDGQLCVQTRTTPRRGDEELQQQLNKILECASI